MVSYRTPLARARGLGSAKHGSGHWVAERVTSIALVPLSLWAVCSGLTLTRVGYQGAAAWAHSPLNAVLSILLLAVGFKHLEGGIRVVIEDYMHVPMTRNVALLANLFVCTLVGALAIFCILKVAFGAAAIPA
ncbi:MAG TPA: succinate dehydrogenase, hydrophobic membrane anchor protein [Caulobacteraceae bacterium]|nr:succinate dehydrogenase, hydrophobic membrane anchor protein [Caulobacteraceae bacterium]